MRKRLSQKRAKIPAEVLDQSRADGVEVFSQRRPTTTATENPQDNSNSRTQPVSDRERTTEAPHNDETDNYLQPQEDADNDDGFQTQVVPAQAARRPGILRLIDSQEGAEKPSWNGEIEEPEVSQDQGFTETFRRTAHESSSHAQKRKAVESSPELARQSPKRIRTQESLSGSEQPWRATSDKIYSNTQSVLPFQAPLSS